MDCVKVFPDRIECWKDAPNGEGQYLHASRTLEDLMQRERVPAMWSAPPACWYLLVFLIKDCELRPGRVFQYWECSRVCLGQWTLDNVSQWVEEVRHEHDAS